MPSLHETSELLANEYAVLEVEVAATAPKSKIQMVITGAAVATIAFGAIATVSGLSCMVGGACPLAKAAASQELFTTQALVSAPSASTFVNSKTGRSLSFQPLRASKSSDVERPLTFKDKAAKTAAATLLGLAAAAAPAMADSPQNEKIAQLMAEWNTEYGSEYGNWNMQGYNIKPKVDAAAAVAAAPPVMAQAPPKKAPVKELDPIEQVMAEWNKEYGTEFGTWDMKGYQPERKSAPAAKPAPATKAAPKTAARAPAAPVTKAPAAPAAPAAASSEEGGSSSGLVIGGLVLVAAGAAALTGKKDPEEASAAPAAEPAADASEAPSAEAPSAEAPTDEPKA